MRILHVSIENFRGVQSASIDLPTHALFVGPNNTCKTTILEALDLVLGADRGRGADVISEHDFFGGSYYDVVLTGEDQGSDGAGEEDEQVGADNQFPEIRIVATLGDLSDEDRIRFRGHLEPWSHEHARPLLAEEVEDVSLGPKDLVLRVGFRGWYDEEEDDFVTRSYFLNPAHPTGERDSFGRKSKQTIGFLYLRSLRTGRRAASMERGSLLETLLRARTGGTQVWESLIRELRGMGEGLNQNQPVREALDVIEQKIRDLTPLAEGQASGLQVGRLTRQHLRENLTYFLSSRDSNHLLPYDRLGSGTSNVLVLALLGAISEAKTNVIFAMEEPEIGLSPHTQRVIVQKLRAQSAQALVTSHSPYVAECFLPDDIVVLRRSEDGAVRSSVVVAGTAVKEKALRRDFRTRFAEGMMARAVLLVEGPTELWALPAAIDVLANVARSSFRSLDLDGMVVLPADGTGEIPKLAEYFSELGIPVHVFCDKVDAAQEAEISEAAASVFFHPYSGFEPLLADELSPGTTRRLVRLSESWPDYPRNVVPLDDAADDAAWSSRCRKLLKMRKGEGWAQRFLSHCHPDELPESVVGCIAHMRKQMGHSPLSVTDPLADLFHAADPASVERPETGAAELNNPSEAKEAVPKSEGPEQDIPNAPTK